MILKNLTAAPSQMASVKADEKALEITLRSKENIYDKLFNQFLLPL